MLINYIVGPVAIIERAQKTKRGLPFSFVLRGWQTDIVQLAGLHKYRPLIFFFIFNQILFNYAFKKYIF